MDTDAHAYHRLLINFGLNAREYNNLKNNRPNIIQRIESWYKVHKSRSMLKKVQWTCGVVVNFGKYNKLIGKVVLKDLTQPQIM